MSEDFAIGLLALSAVIGLTCSPPDRQAPGAWLLILVLLALWVMIR
jgi:hypothetical protein